MRKSIYYFLILFLLIIVSIPLIDGILFQKNIVKLVETINQDHRVKIEILEYYRGWFSSQAKIKVTLSSKDVNYLSQTTMLEFHPTASISFILEEKIKHGPVIYDNQDLQFGYANIQSKLIIDHTKVEFMRIDILSAFNNVWRGRFSTSPWHFSLPYINALSVESFNGEFNLRLGKKGIKHIKTNTQLGPITIEFNDESPFIKRIVIQKIKSEYDAVHKRNYTWSGQSSTYTPGMIITTVTGNEFVIDKLVSNNTFSAAGNTLYSINVTLSIQNLTSPTYTIPAFSSLQIILSATNFNTKSLTDYLNTIQSKSPTELTNIDLKEIETVLTSMVTPISLIKGTVTSDTSLGSFTSRFKTILPDGTPLPKTVGEISTDSETTIVIKMSNLLVMKLLSIYGEQITATNKELDTVRQQTIAQEKENFKNQNTSSQTPLKQALDGLVNLNRITSDLALHILSMAKQKQTLITFSSNLDQLNLPFNIKNQLKLIYQIQLETTKTITLDKNDKQLMDDLLSIGYLRKEPDKDEYSSKIIFKEGKIFISGSPLINSQE